MDSFNYGHEKKGMELFAYVVMTNHIHCILRSKTQELPGLVRDFKKHTSKKLLAEVEHNRQESRKDRLQLIFKYHAKYNKRVAGQQLWTHSHLPRVSPRGPWGK